MKKMKNVELENQNRKELGSQIFDILKNSLDVLAQIVEGNTSQKIEGEKQKDQWMEHNEKFFRVDISNTSQQAVNIAITPGHYKSLKEIKKIYSDVTAILKDGVQTVLGGKIVCTPCDPPHSIRSFLEYIKFCPMVVGMIRIRAVPGNIAVFSNKLKLSITNPFNRTEEIPIGTERFFRVEQYQDGMIDIDVSEKGLIVNFNLMMILTIPPQTTLGFDMYFKD